MGFGGKGFQNKAILGSSGFGGSHPGAPEPAGSSIAWVQAKSGTTGDGRTPFPVTFDQNPAPGNRIIICASYPDSATLDSNPVYDGNDSQANSPYSDAGRSSALFSALATTEPSVIAMLDGSTRLSMQNAEFSGLAADPMEAAVGDAVSGATVTWPTITPISANNLLVITVAYGPDRTVVTPPAGWTELDSIAPSIGGDDIFQRSYYLIQSAATPQQPELEFDGGVNAVYVGVAYGGA